MENSNTSNFDEIFFKFDPTKQGKVSFSEFEAVLLKLGTELTRPEILEIFTEAKSTQEEFLTKEEFDKFLANKVFGKGFEDDLVSAFLTFDRDGDGFITKDELQLAVGFIGEKIVDEEIEKIIRQTDKDQDGKISFSDFRKTMIE